MPPATEKPEAPPAPTAPVPVVRGSGLFSPVGLAAFLVVLVGYGAAVWFLARRFGEEKTKTPVIKQKFVSVDLGNHRREIPIGDSQNYFTEVFMVHVVVQLNPNFEGSETLKGIVESRKDLLKDKVNEIIYSKRKDYFFAENVLATLKSEIRHQLNAALQSTEDGQEIISEVLFPESSLPSHR